MTEGKRRGSDRWALLAICTWIGSASPRPRGSACTCTTFTAPAGIPAVMITPWW